MNILMISLHYHHYTDQIADEFRALGHQVAVHDIMPRTLAMRTLRVTIGAEWQRRLDNHHAAILEAERGKPYDLVFFNQAHQMSLANLAAFRAAFPRARFQLYYWDSIANHDYRRCIPFFDDVSTFDPDDARAYGLHYVPLFCSRAFQELARREQERKAIYFVGNIVTPQRYVALAAFRKYCEDAAIPLHQHPACTPPAFLRMLRHGVVPRGLKFGPIPPDRFIDMVETSVATFDFANHHQSGFTMRVIENLCAGKKIVTSNVRVKQESFYSPDRIHVFDSLDFSGVRAFLDMPLGNPQADFPEYHIQAFARHLVEGTAHPLPAPVQ